MSLSERILDEADRWYDQDRIERSRELWHLERSLKWFLKNCDFNAEVGRAALILWEDINGRNN